MKKIISLIIANVICLLASAQLSQTFQGCTLGTSTFSDVEYKLNQNGYKPKRVPTQLLDCKFPTPLPKFYTLSWEDCIFKFSNGILSEMYFINICETIGFAEMLYNKLKSHFGQEYPSYFWKSYVSEDKAGGIKALKGFYYHSGRVYVEVFYGTVKLGTPIIVLKTYYRF